MIGIKSASEGNCSLFAVCWTGYGGVFSLELWKDICHRAPGNVERGDCDGERRRN